jgi:hypothetical protein
VAEALDVSARTVRRWVANGDLIVLRIDAAAPLAPTKAPPHLKSTEELNALLDVLDPENASAVRRASNNSQ